MNKNSYSPYHTGILILAPAVLMAAHLYHPHVGNPLDDDFLANIASAVAADSTRWALSHLMVGVASGLVMLAFLTIRNQLREAGEERWSNLGIPFIILGSTFYAMLPGMEFAPLTAAESGADIQASQNALYPWFIPVLFSGAFIFAIGAICFSIGIVHSKILNPGLTKLVAGALIIMAAARFVPLSVVQFHVHGAAAIVAMWPLAYLIWSHPEIQTEREPGPVTAG